MNIIEVRYFTRSDLNALRWGINKIWRDRANRILANNGKPHLYWSKLFQGYYDARILES